MDTGPNLLIISFFLYQLFVHNTTLPASAQGLQTLDKAPIVCRHTYTHTLTSTHTSVLTLILNTYVITDAQTFFYIDQQALTVCPLTFTGVHTHRLEHSCTRPHIQWHILRCTHTRTHTPTHTQVHIQPLTSHCAPFKASEALIIRVMVVRGWVPGIL